MTRQDQIYREADGQRVPGVELPVFIHNGPYHLIGLKVFRDGMIDCWELVSFPRFKQKVEEGWVVTALPEGAAVSVFALGQFKAIEVRNQVRESELVKEVADVIEELNGRPTAGDRCLDALKAYKERPSPESKEALREAYVAIPAHNRRYVLGNMDLQDLPIRMILDGDQEVERWSHRRAGVAAGMKPPPGIDVPEVLEQIFPSPKKRLNAALAMSLQGLYRYSGIGSRLFPEARLAEVESLFREGQEESGLRTLLEDLHAMSALYPARPFVRIRLSSALSSLADYLEGIDRHAQAVELHLEACRMNPDGPSPLRLAQMAVQRGERTIARRLTETMRSLDLPPWTEGPATGPFAVDRAAFEALL